MTTPILLIAGLVLLYLGGEGLVRAAATIGVRLGMSPLVAGLTIVAFATSAPELGVSVDSALRGIPGLSVGNVVGSNICNISLILGLTMLMRPASLRQHLGWRDAGTMLGATLLVPLLFFDLQLSRFEGLLLLAGISLYVVLSLLQSNQGPDAGKSELPVMSESLLLNIVVVLVSVALLVAGSELFVMSAAEIAAMLGVSSAVIGLSVAALATSLPELAASVVCARHGHPEMAAGNLIGSNIFNLLLILGATAVVRPLTPDGLTGIDLGLMIGVSVLALGLMAFRHRVGRVDGSALILIYGLYMTSLFLGA